LLNRPMAYANRRIGVLLLAFGLFGCGGSIQGNTGPDGGTAHPTRPDALPPPPCATMSACECMAAGDRCTARTEACWCPSECNPQIACICGGGQFLGCDDKAVVDSCDSELAAVQAKCANQPFVQYIGDFCRFSSRTPACVAGCLAKLEASGSCSEIDCSFCPVCDCAGPATPSPFAACFAACATSLPD
jgi:hypothetical protein